MIKLINNYNFLTKTDLKESIPAIFASNRNEDTTSEKYSFISSEKIINQMSDLGWEPVTASQQKSKENIGHSMHSITFWNKNVKMIDISQSKSSLTLMDPINPEIRLVNSSDGKTSLKFVGGVHRKVCSNGLVVFSNLMDTIKVKHMGFDIDSLEKMLDTYAKQMTQVTDNISRLIKIEMTEDKIKDYAVKAAAIRFSAIAKEKGPSVFESIAKNVVTSHRPQDNQNDLWTIFNRAQENLIKGGIPMGQITGSTRHSKAVNTIRDNIEINKKLWDLTMQYA